MHDDEITPPRQTTPTSLPRHGTNSLMRPPDEADREYARRMREAYGSDPALAYAVLARALEKLEKDSGERSNEETAALLELPARVAKLETPVAIGKWLGMTLAGGLVGGVLWAAHAIGASGEERGIAAEQARTFKSEIESLKSSKADIGSVEAVRGVVEELKRDVRYLERHEDKK